MNIQQSENTVINIKSNSEVTEQSIIPGYTSGESYYSEYIHTSSNTDKCWNCYHSINSILTSIPLKYTNGIFYIYGNFCSYECAGRYILDTYNDKNMWETYSLLNLYYNISNHTVGNKITPAPSKLLLKEFGGTMDINEYRNICTTENLYDIYQPPIIPIKHKACLVENKSPTDNKHNFRLYRRNPINTSNNIYDTMNLTKDNDILGNNIVN